jgi:hypothetical protein
MACYTIEDYEQIESDGFMYTMEPITLSLVNSLAETVGAVSYSRTPIFPPKKDRKERRGGDKRRQPDVTINDDDWKIMRDFKKTEMAVKEGNDKRISEIRGALNKISDDNFEKYTSYIIEKIEETEGNSDNFEPIVQQIFAIASTNIFYSSLYVSLYKTLLEKWSEFDTIFQKQLQNYEVLFKGVESIDPAKDYDGFCRVNKNNEIRRALSTFIANLVVQEVLSLDILVDIINTLQLSVEELIYVANQKNIVDELVENISILIKIGRRHLMADKSWSGLNSTFMTMTKISPKTTPSLSNKTIFKYMDIVEEKTS